MKNEGPNENEMCLCLSKNRKFHKFQIPTYEIIICFTDDSIFLVFSSILVIVRRSAGPDFDRIFEVPKII